MNDPQCARARSWSLWWVTSASPAGPIMSCFFLGSLLLFCGCFASPLGGSRQTVSPVRVYALPGDDVIFPCRLPAPVNVSLAVYVECSPTGREAVSVFVVRGGKLLTMDQHQDYRGRAILTSDGSLELRNVAQKDFGNYTCKVKRTKDQEPDLAFVSLLHANMSEIIFTVQRTPSNELIVHCKSSGWRPEPVISLVDATGHAFPAQKEPAVREGDVFSVWTHLNVTAFKRSEALTCRVEIPGSSGRKELTVHFNDEFDSLVVGSSISIFFLVLGCVSTVVVAFFVSRSWRPVIPGWRGGGTEPRPPAKESLLGNTDSTSPGDGAGPPSPGTEFFQPFFHPDHEDMVWVSTTGASEDTSRSNKTYDENGKLVIGVDASFELARQDWREISKYRSSIVSVGTRNEVHPALIAALISRQSRGGTHLRPSGFGISDPQCYGLMQINKAYHAVVGDPYSEEHIEQGVTLLVQLLLTMRKTKTNWTNEQQLKGALASYIAGVETVIQLDNPEDVDSVTPGGDFANDLIARAQWFSGRRDERL